MREGTFGDVEEGIGMNRSMDDFVIPSLNDSFR